MASVATCGDYVPHGMRSAFRDWSGEVSSFPRDVCEMALGHGLSKSKVEAAYRRGSLMREAARDDAGMGRMVRERRGR